MGETNMWALGGMRMTFIKTFPTDNVKFSLHTCCSCVVMFDRINNLVFELCGVEKSIP